MFLLDFSLESPEFLLDVPIDELEASFLSVSLIQLLSLHVRETWRHLLVVALACLRERAYGHGFEPSSRDAVCHLVPSRVVRLSDLDASRGKTRFLLANQVKLGRTGRKLRKGRRRL